MAQENHGPVEIDENVEDIMKRLSTLAVSPEESKKREIFNLFLEEIRATVNLLMYRVFWNAPITLSLHKFPASLIKFPREDNKDKEAPFEFVSSVFIITELFSSIHERASLISAETSYESEAMTLRIDRGVELFISELSGELHEVVENFLTDHIDTVTNPNNHDFRKRRADFIPARSKLTERLIQLVEDALVRIHRISEKDETEDVERFDFESSLITPADFDRIGDEGMKELSKFESHYAHNVANIRSGLRVLEMVYTPMDLKYSKQNFSKGELREWTSLNEFFMDSLVSARQRASTIRASEDRWFS